MSGSAEALPAGVAPTGPAPVPGGVASAPAAPGALPIQRGPPPPAAGTVLLVEFSAAQLGAV